MKMKGRQKRGRNRSPLRVSLLLSIRLFVCAFAVLQILHPNMVHGQEGGGKEKTTVDVDKVKKYIIDLGNQDMKAFTHEQLAAWFLNQTNGTNVGGWDYPRAFPFCVTHDQIVLGNEEAGLENQPGILRRVAKESHLYKFERCIFEMELQRKLFHHFDPKLDSTIHNKTFVESIEFSRINTPEPDMVNLRQWVHITVKMAEPMVGLYMQSIVGPFGLPYGEFSTEFPCADDLERTGDMPIVGQLAFCASRPLTNIYHPSVYVGFNDVRDEVNDKNPGKPVYKGKKEFHLHFKWFDVACMETPYVQFLMVIMKRFDYNPVYGVDYVTQLSPVFKHPGFDTNDAYPYYPGHSDKMFCFLKSQPELQKKYAENKPKPIPTGKTFADYQHANISWEQEPRLTRIQPNEEYDHCVLHGKPVDETKTAAEQQEGIYECGPGPFNCTGVKVGMPDVPRDKWILKEVNATDECHICGVPECTAIGFLSEYCDVDLPPVNDLEQETNVLTELDDNNRIRAHGVSGMLSFLFFIPIGHFVGRFYKEVMGKSLFGNGPWIFVHLMCSMLALTAIWTSMGPMIPTLATIRARRKVCKKFYKKDPAGIQKCLEGYEIKSPHTVSGLIAIILLHVVPLFGFIRPPSNKLRFIMSAVHSHLGYFTYGLGVVSVFIAIKNPRCFDTLVFCIILIALPLIFSGIAFVLDMMSDKSLGVKPGRKQWPVLEQLQLESRGPLEFPKLIVLAIFLVLMALVWFLALVSLHIVEDSGDKLLEGVNDFKGAKGAALGKLQGLFGECGTQTNKSAT